MTNKIPIRNIYYLLCYAWDQLDESDLVNVDGIESNELADLYAAVLINGVNHTLRRGLDRGYEPHQDELSTIRGQIDLSYSIKRHSMLYGKVYCRYDEFTINTPANQIIKSTMLHLAKVPSLDRKLRTKLLLLHRDLNGIDEIPLNKFQFRLVQLHSNNRFYKFLLNICEMIQAAWLVDESSGRYRFRDFLRDDKKMAALFERFVLNFYKQNLPDANVKKEIIRWNATSLTDPELKLLPNMETDISIRDNQRTLIIDTKYYSKTLTSFYESHSIRSAHLYQITSYLRNIVGQQTDTISVEGMLLYPVTDRQHRETYNIDGSLVHVCTLDLLQDWQCLHDELLDLVSADVYVA